MDNRIILERDWIWGEKEATTGCVEAGGQGVVHQCYPHTGRGVLMLSLAQVDCDVPAGHPGATINQL